MVVRTFSTPEDSPNHPGIKKVGEEHERSAVESEDPVHFADARGKVGKVLEVAEVQQDIDAVRGEGESSSIRAKESRWGSSRRAERRLGMAERGRGKVEPDRRDLALSKRGERTSGAATDVEHSCASARIGERRDPAVKLRRVPEPTSLVQRIVSSGQRGRVNGFR